MKKVLFIYHSADNDGHCCAAIARYFFERENVDLTLYPYNYKRSIMPIIEIIEHKNIDTVIMADVSFDLADMLVMNQYLSSKEIPFTLIDHHKSVIEDYKNEISPSSEYLTDIAKAGGFQIFKFRNTSALFYYADSMSASELTWKVFFNEPIPKIVDIIGRYDFRVNGRYDNKPEGLEEFNLGSKLLTSEELIEYILSALENNLYPLSIIEDGVKIKRFTELENQKISYEIIDAGILNTSFTGVKVLISNTTANPSHYKPNDIYDFVCCYHKVKDGWKYHLRPGIAKNYLDLSEIAKFWGGGGHVKACGFQWHENIFS